MLILLDLTYMNKLKKGEIVIYQKENGAVELRGDFVHETIWASLNQIAELFDTDKSGISRHINNIFKSGELDKKRTVANFATVQDEGEREVTRNIEYFNLDIILAVGYRVSSKKATSFRKWATKTLSAFITKGFVINKNIISKNYQQFLEAVNDVKKLLPKSANIDTENVLELIGMFANTWLSLDAYDKNELIAKGATKRHVVLTTEKLSKNLDKLKQELVKNKQATDLFGLEQRGGALTGIIGNVMQAFAGRELYGSVEEKAAHLLYFIVKDHPFADGNKRSGAFAFAWFLREAKILNKTKITPPALTALTILVAESNPKEKEKMIKLILTLLK